MNIAELFVNLGIKGSEKTVGALKQTYKGLGEVKSMSFETKAGLLAVFYGIQQITSASAAAGTSLKNFEAETGMSGQALQRWSWAAQQAGIKGDEFKGSLMNVQSGITKMLSGQGQPKGFGLIGNAVNITKKDLGDMYSLMGKLQEFALKNNSTLATEALKSMGLSGGVIAAMRRNAFTPEMLKKAPTYSEGEINSLDKVNAKWANLGTKIEMAFGRFTAKHGNKIIDDISMITTEVIKLVTALTQLADKLEVFRAVSDVFDGWSKIIRLMNGESVDDIMKSDKVNGKRKRAFGEGTWWMKGIDSVVLPLMDGSQALQAEHARNWQKNYNKVNAEKQKALAMPRMTSSYGVRTSDAPSQNVEVNQTLIFNHDGKDHKKNTESHKKAIQGAFRQSPSLKGGY